MLQMSVNSGPGAVPNGAVARTLAQLPEGEAGVLDRLDLPGRHRAPLDGARLSARPHHRSGSQRARRRTARVSRGRLGSRAAPRNCIAPDLRGHLKAPKPEAMSDCHDCAGCAVAEAPPPLHKSARTHVVAIIGPPNSGKSTLFNRLTGLRQKVANFPGVTVEQRVGKATHASITMAK